MSILCQLKHHGPMCISTIHSCFMFAAALQITVIYVIKVYSPSASSTFLQPPVPFCMLPLQLSRSLLPLPFRTPSKYENCHRGLPFRSTWPFAQGLSSDCIWGYLRSGCRVRLSVIQSLYETVSAALFIPGYTKTASPGI